jgi:hypothetical protein
MRTGATVAVATGAGASSSNGTVASSTTFLFGGAFAAPPPHPSRVLTWRAKSPICMVTPWRSVSSNSRIASAHLPCFASARARK